MSAQTPSNSKRAKSRKQRLAQRAKLDRELREGVSKSVSKGNRCGHDPKAMRFCDSAIKRGRSSKTYKPHHQLIQVMASYVREAGLYGTRLKTWGFMNRSGCRRNSARREAMVAVIQYLLGKDFQLETRRCGRREGDYIVAPYAKLIARGISKSDEWQGTHEISPWRVRHVIQDFEACGYITRTKQQRRKKESGRWLPGPRMITFTKRFFLELGGKALLGRVMAAGKEKSEQIKEQFAGSVEHVSRYFMADKVIAPYQRNLVSRPPPDPYSVYAQ